MKKNSIFKVLSLAVVFAVFFFACGEDQNNNNSGNNNGTGSHDVDSSLYGTWKNNNSTLTATFSSSGVTWGGAVGSALNIQGAVWTAKNGTISYKYTYSGATTSATAFTYTMSSGNLILTSSGTSQQYTLVKDGETPGGQEQVLGSGTYGNFEYDYGATTIMIKRYKGSGGALTIPSTIDGKPVVAILDSYKDGTDFYGVFERKNLTSVTIPNSVTYIGSDAFYNNQLTSVTIPNSVTYIGSLAFSSNRLTSITIPNSVTYLSGFSGNQLTSVTIPNSVTEIGAYAFGSNQLTSVIIPNSVTTIGARAFQDNKLTSVTIPNSVTSIELNAFQDNKLSSVSIGNSVTKIGSQAFSINQLVSIVIPNSVTEIGYEAFTASPLASITIGANVLLGTWGYSSFPGGFDTFYNNGGKLAGAYTFQGTISNVPFVHTGSWSKN